MAKHDITVMPGCGVNATNVFDLAQLLTLTEVHGSCSIAAQAPQNSDTVGFGFLPAAARATDATRVAALRKSLDQIAGARTSG